MSKRKQLPWMAHVAPGDVLRTGSGDLRVVRDVSRYKDGDLRCCSFVIRRCSWTHRPYTTINYTDLRLLGYAYTGVRVKLNQRLQRGLGLKTCDPSKLDCCDVKGLP